MPISLIFEGIWRWVAETGIDLALLILLAFLVPRAGRFANRIAERRLKHTDDPDEIKSKLAVTGVGIYIAQLVAYFLLFVFILQELGFSLAGAAIPATVVSAAIGFGAQNIIADFLAGFFILTEKQYGVGDYVTFEGNGINVSGEVIQITMRATQIRTIEQSTVSIPNSTARICINQSNYWANALVVMPVPLLGSTSAEEAVARAEQAARRALAEPTIFEVIKAELEVHPAVAINTPATVGSPWTVDIRFMVRVEPLMQWKVERAIRLAILDEFWDEYGSAATVEGTPVQSLYKQDEDEVQTQRMTPQTASLKPTTSPTKRETKRELPTTDTVHASDPAAADTIVEPDAAHQESANAPNEKRVFHGTMRASTAVLLAVFACLLIVRGLTLQPTAASDASAGILAPPVRSSQEVVPSAPEIPQSPEPTMTSEISPSTHADIDPPTHDVDEDTTTSETTSTRSVSNDDERDETTPTLIEEPNNTTSIAPSSPQPTTIVPTEPTVSATSEQTVR